MADKIGHIETSKFLCLHEEIGAAEIDDTPYRLIRDITSQCLLVTRKGSDKRWVVSPQELFTLGVDAIKEDDIQCTAANPGTTTS